MRERTIDIRDHTRFVDYLSQNGFLKISRIRKFKKYWDAPPDVIRAGDGKPFEVKSFREGGSISRLIYAIGQPLVFRCMYGDGGIIYPKEVKTAILRKNKELGDPFGKYNIEALFL